ncbi:Gfo/Idh/MocA family oxidoreductase [Neobacillus mesonae]|nr:Gfo/Idh/MocA family oxidoreductase [Neobacillus mesonae]
MPADKRMKIAIMGCGADGKRYAESYSKHPGVELIGICDRNFGAALSWADHYNTTAFNSLPDLLAKAKPDLLHFTFPAVEHLSDLYLAAKEGIHLVCDKPIGVHSSEMDRIEEICSLHGAKVIPYHHALHDPAYADMAQNVKAGAIGQPGVVHIRRVIANSHHNLMNSLIEDIEYMCHLLGEVETVFAQQISRSLTQFVLVTLKFQRGTIVNLEGILEVSGHGSTEVEMAGNKGIIRSNSEKSAAVEVRKIHSDAAKYTIVDSESPHRRSEISLSSPSFEDSTSRFIRSVIQTTSNQTKPEITYRDSWNAAIVIEAARFSAEHKQSVNMNTFRLSKGWWRDA